MRAGVRVRLAILVALLYPVFTAITDAETVREGNLQIAFSGKIIPRKLPRAGSAPVSISLSASIRTVDHSAPPQLRTIELAINRNGRVHQQGLPVCEFRQIQPASNQEARAACPGAVVGRGTFKADVALPEQSPYPSDGTILAFNGRLRGKPAILVHIYGTEPLPTSFTLPFEVKHRLGGPYGTLLTASMPQVAADWGSVNGISLTLQRRFHYQGRTRSYISASCPAPKGFPGASFTLANAVLGFEGGKTLSTTMTRSCSARG